MRYNKQELVALASQTAQNFDREGVLVLKERQDGFFRRSEGRFSCFSDIHVVLYDIRIFII